MILIRQAKVSDMSMLNRLCYEQETGVFSLHFWQQRDDSILYFEKIKSEHPDLIPSNVIVTFTEALIEQFLLDSSIYFVVAETLSQEVVAYLVVSLHSPENKILSNFTSLPPLYANIERLYVRYDFHGEEVELDLLKSFKIWKEFNVANTIQKTN